MHANISVILCMYSSILVAVTAVVVVVVAIER